VLGAKDSKIDHPATTPETVAPSTKMTFCCSGVGSKKSSDIADEFYHSYGRFSDIGDLPLFSPRPRLFYPNLLSSCAIGTIRFNEDDDG
jgi:hypothetical protein